MATRPQGNGGRPRFGPSECLIALFRACSRDPTEVIETRLTSMLRMFLQHHRDNAGNGNANDLAATCCERARMWYYRILEYLACQERKRLGIIDISVILENDLFQSCLVACCLEITISSNHLPYDFPLLLQILKLAPYHFLKVIEPVLRAEVGLPRAVVRHLAQVQEKVLESLSWTSDSPLWKDIRANKGHMPTCKQVMLPTQLEDSERKDFQPDTNQPGVELNLGAELSDSTDQQRSPSAGNRPQKSNPLHLFARKVYSLMGKRLRELCATLNISDDLRLKIWTCFEHSLVHCTDLMVDRHLDQLLMCAIYIIAKITNLEIPFKLIMKCYKSQPLASKSVCKNVLMSRTETENYLTGNNNNGNHGVSIPTPNTPSTHYPEPSQERGNLIYFYNQIYTTKMQHFAKQFAPTSARDTPPLSPYPRQWKASPRRQRLSSSHSIYISPHNTETTSPRTPGLLYYFNSSPRECLHRINNMIRTGRPPNRRCYVVSLDREEQKEEEREEEEDGPSAKRLCLEGQSAWQRRLRNVVNDRVTRRDQHQPSPVTRPKLH
ncbi:retinoblastoma-like protein 2 [Etheostoma spectabile]|uniref:retinoblastoma-like protein 2 n=1 Tax=Etheostoma spectabile TaxID=54343 RepID=UPI0013AED84E|nr:retinoblastoma-like protein 2 [Etheostoma spectabile]XP_032376750.1 retinoblastoma-like protein 2 [Etheostoma spectabile]